MYKDIILKFYFMKSSIIDQRVEVRKYICFLDFDTCDFSYDQPLLIL